MNIIQDCNKFEITLSTLVMSIQSNFTVGIDFEQKHFLGELMKVL